MPDYRYILEKGSRKHFCPGCGLKTFVRFIDNETQEYLPDQYGRCDREISCTYFINPYKDGYFQGRSNQNFHRDSKTKSKSDPRKKTNFESAFIPFDVLKQTRKGWEQNTFLQNLLNRIPYPFCIKEVEHVVAQYHLGTVGKGYRAGGITFPFIDKCGNIRTIQVKQFDNSNHTLSNGTDFLHSIIEKYYNKKKLPLPEWLEVYLKNEIKVSCLFGEHLINKYPLNPIALVEAPKTAIYGTMYFGFPDNPKNLLWLAVYSLSSLTIEKCKALQGRNVYLFPDLSKDGKAFQLWSNKAKEFSERIPGTNFVISNLLEKKATDADRSKGLDLADFLIRQDWRKFRSQQIVKQEEKQLINEAVPALKDEQKEASKEPKTSNFLPIIKLPEETKPESWDEDITELENYFKSIPIRIQPIKLNQSSTITNVSLFVERHFDIVKGNNGKRTFLPYLNRLQELKQYFIQNLNI